MTDAWNYLFIDAFSPEGQAVAEKGGGYELGKRVPLEAIM